jgi:hypothetical protein
MAKRRRNQKTERIKLPSDSWLTKVIPAEPEFSDPLGGFTVRNMLKREGLSVPVGPKTLKFAAGEIKYNVPAGIVRHPHFQGLLRQGILKILSEE